jgi:hypothetical protein
MTIPDKAPSSGIWNPIESQIWQLQQSLRCARLPGSTRIAGPQLPASIWVGTAGPQPQGSETSIGVENWNIKIPPQPNFIQPNRFTIGNLVADVGNDFRTKKFRKPSFAPQAESPPHPWRVIPPTRSSGHPAIAPAKRVATHFPSWKRMVPLRNGFESQAAAAIQQNLRKFTFLDQNG